MFPIQLCSFITQHESKYICNQSRFNHYRKHGLLYCNTHGSVLSSTRKQGPQKTEWVYLTGTTHSQFSRIHSSVIPNPNGTKFTVEVPSNQGRPYSKLEEDSFSHSQDTSNQTLFLHLFLLILFPRFARITITHVCVLQSGWNLEHLLGSKGKHQYQI